MSQMHAEKIGARTACPRVFFNCVGVQASACFWEQAKA
jgi:hypothetical protein